MPTFIDESGNTGWKPGSLPFFRLASFCLPIFATAETGCTSIQAARVLEETKADKEFKIARTAHRPETRRAIYRAALWHEFRLIVRSEGKHSLPVFSVEASGFHWGCAVLLVSYLRDCERESSGGVRRR